MLVLLLLDHLKMKPLPTPIADLLNHSIHLVGIIMSPINSTTIEIEILHLVIYFRQQVLLIQFKDLLRELDIYVHF